MGIVEELDAEREAQRPKPSCHVCAWLEEQSPQDQVTWDAQLQTTTKYSNAVLASVIGRKSDGFVTEHSVASHRRGRHRGMSS